jgi:hypothetical protein
MSMQCGLGLFQGQKQELFSFFNSGEFMNLDFKLD